MKKKVSKSIWILTVFVVFIAVAMSFVSWLIYAVFSENYREIKQQYYAVVSRQIVEDIENSVKNGKQIERFYGMDKVLNNMLEIISTDNVPLNAAITDVDGNVLYDSYTASGNGADYYNALIAGETVQASIRFNDGEGTYTIINQSGYEMMIQPVYDAAGTQIGSMLLFYRTEDVESELLGEKERSNITTLLCAGVVILVMVVYFIAVPRSITEDDENGADEVTRFRKKSLRNRVMFVVPVIMIMAGLMAQCVLSYNAYQKRYKRVMFEGATGISRYLGDIIDELNGKGVPYDKMNGLAEYLSGKVQDSPLLWNVSVVSVYADTSSLLERDSEYNVSLPISTDDDSSMHINIEISKAYIDEKMLDMLLVFAMAFAVAILMIYELLKLPDALFTRLSKDFKGSREVQAATVAPMVRLAAFIAFTGLYIGTPFSAVLINQWNKTLFGLPVNVVASIPMTAELLSTMLCSLLLLPLYRKLGARKVLTASALTSVAAQILCFMAGGPAQLIVFRFLSGMGFAGIKYALNTVVSQGSVSSDNTTDNLAALNAGLLGGITCGASLGAVIAGSIGVQTSYLIAGIFMALSLAALLGLSPWKLIADNNAAETAAVKRASQKTGALSFLGSFAFWRYMLLVAVPLNFGLMFIVAFFPSFVSSMGMSDIVTSYGYLINGLIGIYLGPKLLKALSRRIGKTFCVALSLLIAAGAVFILNIDIPVVILMVSVALLGLFDGFGTPACSDYYVDLAFVKKIGANQALAVLSVVGSVVQTFSPVLYSLILGGGMAGVNILGVTFGVCAVLFVITAKLGGLSKHEQKDAAHQ